MKRKIVETEDGSKTIHIEDWNETYHSKHGAVQEARHVFINNGLNHFIKNAQPIKILEIGLGTGLNSFITLLEAEKNQLKIEYVGIEKFPVDSEEFEAIDYFEDVFKWYPEFEYKREEFKKLYHLMYECPWEKNIEITPNFTYRKVEKDFFDLDSTTENGFDLVYFDAFGSHAQPEMWEENLLHLIASMMKESSILTTYAAKGSLKRAMKAVGFKVEKRPGPPGKREMMVALRNFDDE